MTQITLLLVLGIWNVTNTDRTTRWVGYFSFRIQRATSLLNIYNNYLKAAFYHGFVAKTIEEFCVLPWK